MRIVALVRVSSFSSTLHDAMTPEIDASTILLSERH